MIVTVTSVLRSAAVPAAQHVGDPFEALGNPQRRAIVELLAARPRSVGELSAELPVSRPAVSRHLRVLSGAGLVREERVGTRHVFRLDEAGARQALDYLGSLWTEAAARFRLFAENTAE